MNHAKIETLFRMAVENLFSKQQDIFSFTSESGLIKWNLTHRLANEISRVLPEYNVILISRKETFKTMDRI